MNLFGFNITKSKAEKEEAKLKSFISPDENDAAIELEGGVGNYQYSQDFDLSYKNEAQLVTHYRAMALHADISSAVDDIVNDAISFDSDGKPVEVNLEKTKFSKGVKTKIKTEFEEILRILNFNEVGDETFRKWYVDGKQYHHIVVNPEKEKEGIKDIRFIDPRNIKKVKNVEKKIENGVEIIGKIDSFFIYEERVKESGPKQTIKIAEEAIVYTHSGLFDDTKNVMLSYLHQAIKPYNQLKSVEDSVVIYRLSRAPERRIFYVDVGNLPKTRAEEYLKSVMSKYRNKIVYDVNTGNVKDSVAHRSMLEDIWLPRREGSRGTEVSTLDGGQNLGELDDVNYFRQKTYGALRIPLTRLDQEATVSISRASEISRDEIKFSKFIEKLRKKFSRLFYKLLKTQLILKKIITEDDWNIQKEDILFNFTSDMHFAELKEAEIMSERVEMLGNIEDYVGKYFSVAYVRKYILRQSEDDIKVMDAQMAQEAKEAEEAGEDEDDEDNDQGAEQGASDQNDNEDDQDDQDDEGKDDA